MISSKLGLRNSTILCAAEIYFYAAERTFLCYVIIKTLEGCDHPFL